MSTTPPEDGPPIPPGYKPGDYVPFKDRDPTNPTSVAGQWADPARQAQQGGGRPMTAEEQFRAIYGYDARMRVVHAGWGRRVAGRLIDTFFGVIAGIPLIIGYVMLAGQIHVETDPTTNSTVRTYGDVSPLTVGVLVVGFVIAIAFTVYNEFVRQGGTGYTLGKAAVGIRLVRESTGQPIGGGLCFLRQLAHYIDSLICYLGWLWPLWDAKHQTIADKIVGTVVVVQDPDQLT